MLHIISLQTFKPLPKQSFNQHSAHTLMHKQNSVPRSSKLISSYNSLCCRFVSCETVSVLQKPLMLKLSASSI